MSLASKILLGLLGLVAVLLAVAFLLPSTAHMERSLLIEAPPSVIFPLLNDLRETNRWSPWAEIDPDTQYTFTGPGSGVGAKMRWESEHPNVGSGSQEIIESVEPSRVTTALDFGPQGTATAYFDLEPEEGGTRVTWGFDTGLGMSPIARYFGLVLEHFLAPDYEKGLGQLKELAESLPQPPSTEIEEMEIGPVDVAFVRGETSQEPEAIHEAMSSALGNVLAVLTQQGSAPVGPPLAMTLEWNEEADLYRYQIGFPVDPQGLSPSGDVEVGQIPGGRVLRAIHVGPFENIGTVYDTLTAYMAEHGLEEAGPSWEQYLSDLQGTPKEQLVTHVYQPVREQPLPQEP